MAIGAHVRAKHIMQNETDYPPVQQFRIWNPEERKFIFSGGTPMMLSGFFEQTATLHTVHKMPYQRSTFLTDKNRALIYEGDKVMATYKENDEEVTSPGVIEWYEREAMFSVKLGDPEGENETWGIIKFSVLEVFGHIYDSGITATA
jgi:hypothetical protein